MKIRNLLLLVFLIPVALTAQLSNRLGVSLYTDYFSVPLSPEKLITQTSGLSGYYLLTEKLNLKLGFEEKLLRHTDSNLYVSDPGIMLGAGYTFWEGQSGTTSAEANLSLTNSLKYFSAFQDYSVSLGARMYFMDVCFLGTGLRYAGFQGNPVLQGNNLNWYWQLGLSLKLGARK